MSVDDAQDPAPRWRAHARVVLGIAQLVGAGLSVALLLTRGVGPASIGAVLCTGLLVVVSRVLSAT